MRDELRHDVRDADGEAHRPAGRPVLQRVLQLAAEREDLLGVAVHDAADVGEHEAAAHPREQLLAERVLERLQLAAHRGLREAAAARSRGSTLPSRATTQKYSRWW